VELLISVALVLLRQKFCATRRMSPSSLHPARCRNIHVGVESCLAVAGNPFDQVITKFNRHDGFAFVSWLAVAMDGDALHLYP